MPRAYEDLGLLFNFFSGICWGSDDFLRVPRDVSGVELLMNNHQSLKAEIDAREENFAICVNLGRDLLARKHYRSPEVSMFFPCFFFLMIEKYFQWTFFVDEYVISQVREKLIQLGTQRGGMMEQWEDRWEYLQLSKFVFLGSSWQWDTNLRKLTACCKGTGYFQRHFCLFSLGSLPVRERCFCGRSLVDSPRTLPHQYRIRRNTWHGRSTDKETWGIRKICSNTRRKICCSGKANNGMNWFLGMKKMSAIWRTEKTLPST